MSQLVLVASVMFWVACGHGSTDSTTGTAGSSASATQTTPSTLPAAGSAATASSASGGAATAVAEANPGAPAAPAPASTEAHDFTSTGKLLLAVGACGEGPAPDNIKPAVIAKHCEVIGKTQANYVSSWVTRAAEFFATHVPATVPKKVVYPFAGGDLSTALTVYPDADEITTMSLEPAGDPRTLEALAAHPGKWRGKPPRRLKQVSPPAGAADATTPPAVVTGVQNAPPTLDHALQTIEYELRFLYRVNFSNTLNMIDAMRGGALPTQLIFGLSALKVHGYELVSLRYFHLDDAGGVVYLTDADVANAPDPTTGKPDARNRIFANAEVGFRKPGGRVQFYRHIQVNLDNDHLKKDPRVIRHLEAKGPVAGMTKAASYLLSWDSFSIIRDYLLGHVQWMVSDATGVAPRWGKPKGFEYETYGAFELPHIDAGNSIARDWRAEFKAEPRRPLKFRFGYYDGSKAHTNHLIIMRRKP